MDGPDGPDVLTIVSGFRPTAVSLASTQKHSVGAKLLLVPEHNLVLASRGSAQSFMRIYGAVPSGKLSRRLHYGAVDGRARPSHGPSLAELCSGRCGTRVGARQPAWRACSGRLVTEEQSDDGDGLCKHDDGGAARVQPREGGLASPGEPLRRHLDSFALAAVLEAGRLQAAYLNGSVGRTVAGGRLLVGVLQKRQASVTNVGAL